MTPPLSVRRATPEDAALLAEHRVAMFRDMGSIDPRSIPDLREASLAYFTSAVATAEYVAWLACDPHTPDVIVAGAGVMLRPMLPRPAPKGDRVLIGSEGIVMNVYTEPGWRRRGIARQMMREIIDWAPAAGIVRLVLHASREGQALYLSMGFTPTNELRYDGVLGVAGGSGGTPERTHADEGGCARNPFE